MPYRTRLDSVSEFLVLYLDSIDERLLDYLDEDQPGDRTARAKAARDRGQISEGASGGGGGTGPKQLRRGRRRRVGICWRDHRQWHQLHRQHEQHRYSNQRWSWWRHWVERWGTVRRALPARACSQVYTPTIAVNDNAPVQAGSTLTFTADSHRPHWRSNAHGCHGLVHYSSFGFSIVLFHHRSHRVVECGHIYVLNQWGHRWELPRDGELSGRHSNYTSASGSDTTATVHTLPTYVSVGAAQTWTTSAAKAVAYPSGAASGDLLVLMIAFSDNAVTLACPSGWKQSGTINTGTGAKAYFESCEKFLTTGTSVSLTPPSTNVNLGWTAEIARRSVG